MLETQDDLETCLSEELEVLKAREQQLEQVALALCQKRQSLQRQREERRSEVARLEIRLHSLRSCGAATTAADAADLADIEAETLEASVDCREAVAEAEAWMSCLPSQVLDDAELGSSFESLCALFRCFHKARILAQSIQDHFVATAALAVLQDVGTMRWLCSVMQAAAMLATAVLGVLGCLSAESPDRYRGLVRLPAVASCGHGEAALDALLRALLDLVRGKATREREGLLAALRAHGAQLLSLQKAMFKDQHFASWQRCCCALEALRGSCAGALYASSNAGGTRRKRWQDLYEEANRFIARLACEDFGSRPLFGIGPSEQEVQKSDSEDASEEEEEEEGEEPHEKERPRSSSSRSCTWTPWCARLKASTWRPTRGRRMPWTRPSVLRRRTWGRWWPSSRPRRRLRRRRPGRRCGRASAAPWRWQSKQRSRPLSRRTKACRRPEKVGSSSGLPASSRSGDRCW
ncbi:unnamed protein product [Effrenium voratum]|nr:unnamed protein product [Effrenium voratum]